MNALDRHIAELNAFEDRQDAISAAIDSDQQRTYQRLLSKRLELVISSGDALRDFDHDTEAVYSGADHVAAILRAYAQGRASATYEHAENLFDHLRASYEEVYGEDIEQEAARIILEGEDDE